LDESAQSTGSGSAIRKPEPPLEIVVPVKIDRTSELLLAKEDLMKSRTAFTLIELLVVISDYCYFGAILFPVFSAAREKGGRRRVLRISSS